MAGANFIRSFKNLDDVQDVLDFHYLQCSLSMDCEDLARSLQYLANSGHCPSTGTQLTTAEVATRSNSLMPDRRHL